MDEAARHGQAMQATAKTTDPQSASSRRGSPPAPAQLARSTTPSVPRPFVNGHPAANTAPGSGIPAWLPKERLVEIRDGLAGTQDPVVDLELLSNSHARCARLESELAALPTFYASRAQLDIDRLATENEQLRVQARALARKVGQINAKGRERTHERERDEDVDVEMQDDTEVEEMNVEELKDAGMRKTGVERENKALKSDVLFLQEKLKISQAQTNRLEHELRNLRSHLLHGTPLVIVDHEVGLPSPPTDASAAESPAELPVLAETGLPALPRTLDFPGPAAAASTSATARLAAKAPAKKPLPKPEATQARPAVLGDAEAELLLHAGKTFSHVRRINRVPLSSAIARRASEIVDVAVEYQIEDDGEEHEQMKGEPVDEDLYSTPYAGVSSRYAVGTVRWDALPPIPSSSRHPAGDGFDGLLQLAEASSQEDVTGAAPRPLKRRRAASNAHDEDDEWVGDEDYAPGPSRRAPATGGNDDPDYLPSPPSAVQGAPSSKGKGRVLGQRLSALDVLVQASASQEAADDSEGAGRADHPPLVVSSNKKKAAGGKGASTGENKTDSKKARSPYIKWNLAEDEMLLKAVIQCGCAWDNVAKLCPTRAYHQVRQRFLRGLKSGETLPPELMHLQPAVLKSVADYEAKKKRKKAAKQAAQEFERREAERLAAAE
ncbi:homeodomain-like containing protein [Rhodotorula toruloides]|uniref:Homeodomain-like containing protein n=1 Tax=Rhodotorula toruloides TaxID=5286 RepID=A0A511KF66_RHOTO|nr:homeodomain-like containing protein [Rhodotorula toruloides]